ncbi:hypothetical protein LTR49_028902, partial [Elasticomyces elasticus]
MSTPSSAAGVVTTPAAPTFASAPFETVCMQDVEGLGRFQAMHWPVWQCDRTQDVQWREFSPIFS